MRRPELPRERERNQQSDDQPTVVQSDFDAEDSAQFNLRYHIFFLYPAYPLRPLPDQGRAVTSLSPVSGSFNIRPHLFPCFVGEILSIDYDGGDPLCVTDVGNFGHFGISCCPILDKVGK